LKNEIAISVQNVGKKYLIGQRRKGSKTIRDSVGSTAAALLERLRRTSHESEQPSGRQEFWALRDVSFKVSPGEIVGLIGRNGAGKSTLLKTLGRITEPTTGRIDIYGRIGSLLEVGTGFNLELSGRDNTYLSGAILGMKKAEIDRHFDEIIAFAEIDRFIDTPVKHYSSGMYLRLAFAVAAHLQPEILLIDEVLAVGDAAFQKKCLGKMDDVAKQGRTVMFVSHNMSAVQELCQRGILIESGNIAFDGPVTECISQYFKRTSATDVAGAEVRSGSDAVQISGVKICDSIMPVIAPDDGFEVTADLRARDIRNPSMILIVESMNGQQIVHSRIMTRDIGIDTLDGNAKVKISLPALWLAPGLYSVYLKLLASSIHLSGRYDSERIMLEVKGGIDGTGRTILAPEAEWKLNRIDVPEVLISGHQNSSSISSGNHS
jgi:lipopolysaccharide transport system ATP-binding protein